MNTVTLLSFITASLIVLVIPGPGVMYVVARSLSQGYTAGLVSALGLSAGVLAHVLASIIGLSAILMTSATAFTIVKYLGAGYLVYLGIRAILSTRTINEPQELNRSPLLRLFLDGVIVSVFNPKIAIFFFSFLPQFVDPGAGSATSQIVTLGLVYAVLALITDSTYGLIAGRIRNSPRREVTGRPAIQYIAGSLLIGLGLKTALSSRLS